MSTIEPQHDHVFDQLDAKCRFCGWSEQALAAKFNPLCGDNPLATIELTQKELDQAVAEYLKRRGVDVPDLAQISYGAKDGNVGLAKPVITTRVRDIVLPETGGPYR